MTDFEYVYGTILGGAVGDALGYPVEFLGEEQIFRKYGLKGICEMELETAWRVFRMIRR